MAAKGADAGGARDTLVVFVRGFRGVNGGVGLRDEFKTQFKRFLTRRGTLEPDLSIGGYPALRAVLGEGEQKRRIDIVEVDWEPKLTKLSTQQVVRRFLFGSLLMLRGFFSAFGALKSPGFLYLTLANLIVLGAWVYLALTATVGVLDKIVHDAHVAVALPGPLSALHHELQPQGWPFLIVTLLIGAMTLIGLSSDVMVDMADTYMRYIRRDLGIGSPLTMRDSLVQMACDAVQAARHAGTSTGSNYGRTVLLGHSFGALIALEAATRFPEVRLVTAGTFFNYLRALNRVAVDEIARNAVVITDWRDFYSPQDWVANSDAFQPGSDRYHPQPVDLRPVTKMQKATTETHGFYFRKDDVFRAILE